MIVLFRNCKIGTRILFEREEKMSQSFTEIVRNDKSLLELLNSSGPRAAENGALANVDIDDVW